MIKIIPGRIRVVLDGKVLRAVESVELDRNPTRDGYEIYATIKIKLDHAETSISKIELSSFTS